MSARPISLRFAACLTSLLAIDVVAGNGAHASSLIPYWFSDTEPRNFILDSIRLNARILDTMALRLGAAPEHRGQNEFCYERRHLGRSAYYYCFRAEWTLAQRDTVFVDSNAWSIDTVRLRNGRLFGYYLFDGYSRSWNPRRTENIASFLHSAYHQHLYPDYRADDAQFIPMPTQSQRGLWMRGLVSPIWAQVYATKGDPFSGPGLDSHFSVYGIIVDGGSALVLLAFIASLIIHDDPERDAGNLAIFAAGHTAVTLGCFLPILSFDLGESIRIRKSGYRFPKGLKTD